MTIFVNDNNKKIVTVNKSLAKSEAIREANKHFKAKVSALFIVDAWIKDDYLYFEKIRGGQNVWAVWKTL